jgi:hypothetical protein
MQAGQEQEGISRPTPSHPTTVDVGARLVAADLERGTWIAVLRADEIPHVVMLQGGTCYSLEHDGNRRYPTRKLWRLAETRHIPMLLCELGPWARGPVPEVYARFERIAGDDGDCFLPVRDYCAAWFADAAACAYPWQLLPLLSSAGKLARAGTLHLAGESDGKRIVLPVYSRADIRARIAEVRRTLRPHG